MIDVLRTACLLSFALVLPATRLIRSSSRRARAIDVLALCGLTCALLALAFR
jgi:hypothetical protein